MTSKQIVARATRVFLLGLAAAWLAGCAGSLKPRAPVEDRTGTPVPPAAGASAPLAPLPAVAASDAPRPPPGIENAGKPGFYTVRPGDTLIRVGLETGQNWRDLQRWNNLDNADRIEVGQVLRVVPPGVDPTVTAARPVVVSRADSRPLDGRTAPSAAASGAANAAASGAANGSGATTTGAVSPPPPAPAVSPLPAAGSGSGPDDEIPWIWPAQGTVVAGFDESRNKGLSIGGKAGDPVIAAADGRVVYAGSGLRGYGNLVIIKHNETFLTAYAHNQSLMVREDQPVRRGQKIAEMGSTDSDRVQLHFEIRRRGKPIDPARLLPGR